MEKRKEVVSIRNLNIEEIRNGFIVVTQDGDPEYFEKLDDALNYAGNYFEHGESSETLPDPMPEK